MPQLCECVIYSLRSRLALAKRQSGRRIELMGNFIAKIKNWLGMDKKPDAPKHDTDAP